MNETTGPIEQEVIMTITEVADYLKIAPSTIYRLARQGKVPGRKIGGNWRFSRRVIDDWLFAQAGSTIPAAEGATPAELIEVNQAR